MGLWSSVRDYWRGGGEAARREPAFQNASPENPSTNLSDPAAWMFDALGSNYADRFGPIVTEQTAMASSAVFRSCALRSGLTAGLPAKIYKRTKDGREEAPGHRLQPMFQVAPYPGRPMTAFTWRELWSLNVDLWGDHFSVIRYDGAARIVGFEAAYPWQVEVHRVNQRNLYRIEWTDGRAVEWVDQEDMIHIPGPGFDGIRGVSRIRHFARNSVALSLMLIEQIGRVHENAARPSGLATPPANISEKGFQRFKSQFTDLNTGRANAGKVIFGDPGTTFTPFQMSPEDLNTIELMRYGVADISRFFGVPLHLLNETDKSTSWGSGLSEQTLAFLIYTLDPDLGRIESELNYKLFQGSEYYVEFDRDALMAMDPVKAAQVAQTEIASGTLLINELRKKKNRPPVDHGDEPMINSTNVPLAKLFNPGAQPRQDPIQADPIAPKPDVGTGGNDGGNNP